MAAQGKSPKLLALAGGLDSPGSRTARSAFAPSSLKAASLEVAPKEALLPTTTLVGAGAPVIATASGSVVGGVGGGSVSARAKQPGAVASPRKARTAAGAISPSKDRHHHHHHSHSHSRQKLGLCMRLAPWLVFAVLVAIGLLVLGSAIFPGTIFLCQETIHRLPPRCIKLDKDAVRHEWISGAKEFNCWEAPQASPVVAHRVDDIKYAFFLSLIDIGPSFYLLNANVKRLLRRKPFLKPDAGVAMQTALETLIDAKVVKPDSMVVDVGAGIGEATFAASAMGVRVTALEPVFANALRLCDGVYLNRADDLVKVHLAAASDVSGNITVHNLMANLEHSAVARAAIALASRDTSVVPTTVEALTVDSLILPKQHVAVLKVTVQGWELHALRGATTLLSRPPKEAPVVLYEEDKILLLSSNTTAADVRAFLGDHGYTKCERLSGLMQCRKAGAPEDT